MSTKRLCFVISPIGPEGSDIRKRADAFLEYLVEPALQKFDFNVVRADKIPQPSAITSDIIRMVQEADLCLIDLTDNNPNVFYECGRRHETGKPFIQLIDKTWKGAIPFDVAGIRTLFYDLSSVPSANQSVKELQQFIDNIVGTGFGSDTTGVSLASIAQGVERIERKIARLLESTSKRPASMDSSDDIHGDLDLIVNPEKAMYSAIRRGDLNRAFRALSNFENNPSKKKTYFMILGLLASGGHKEAFDKVDSILSDAPGQSDSPFDKDALHFCGAMIGKYYIRLGKPEAALEYVSALLKRYEALDWTDDNDKAFLSNQIGMIYWTIDDDENSIKYGEIAVAYNPSEPAYWYNLALSFERQGAEDRMMNCLRRLRSVGDDLNDAHISILAKYGLDS